MKNTYSCFECGKKLSENENTCSNCGCNSKKIEIRDSEKIELHISVKGNVKVEKVGKPIREFQIGDNFHRKTGKWNKLKREIDRKNDSYSEIIRDSDGNIIKKCEEPLSKHRGHGSAKKKK